MKASTLNVRTAPEEWRNIVLRALLFLALLVSAAFLPAESANAAIPLVKGTVTNADNGEPVVGAEITINLVTAPIVNTMMTDAQGKFSFLVDPGGYWIEVSHPDFYFVETEVFELHAGSPREFFISLEPIPPFISIDGADRFATAVTASQINYPRALPYGSDTVVIATGRNWPDALGGAALAGALDGPVLLVDTNAIPAVVLAEIDRLGADKAIILGGTGAVGPAVETALKNTLGAADVTRIGGADRYETANNVAAKVRDILGVGYDGHAFVATGGNFPDALAAAPLAAGNYWPIYLAHPTAGLSASTVTAMTGVTDAIILGGAGAVSTATENGLKTRLGPTKVQRLSGADRYATAAAIAEFAVTESWFLWDRAGLATGTNFPDALAGGVLQGLNGNVMLLTPSNSLHPAAASVLSANALQIDTVVFFGGTGAISQAVRNEALQLVGN